jgi:hypothetical protein
MTTPSSILVAAADRIRDLAAATTHGQWAAGHLLDAEDYGGNAWVESEVQHANGAESSFTVAEFETDQGIGDARWVAALSPAVAPHLEAWLRWCAKSVQVTVEDMGWPANGQEAAALRFAMALCPELAEERTP